jgi:DNA-binding transcriptional ArsR family regulator
MTDYGAYGFGGPIPPVTHPPAPASSVPGKSPPFIKGPICLRWVARAVRLRKPALAAGLALWFLRGVCPHDGPFRITRAIRNKFQLSGPQMSRGLRALEAAKLVRFVKSGRGRCPVVQIIDLTPYRGRGARKPDDPHH